MSEFAEAIYYIAFVLGIPVAFSIVLFVLCLRLVQKYDFWKSTLLVSTIFSIAFYVFRLLYVVILSIRDLSYGDSFSENFGYNYRDLFEWVDTAHSLSYVIDRRFEIHFPQTLYFNQWLGVSIMEVLFYLSLGLVITVTAKLWKGGSPRKLGAPALLLPIWVFYLYVIGHWMYLSMHL